MKPILWGNYAGSTMPLHVVVAYQAYQLRIQLDSPILANVAQYPQLRVSPVSKKKPFKCYYTESILLYHYHKWHIYSDAARRITGENLCSDVGNGDRELRSKKLQKTYFSDFSLLSTHAMLHTFGSLPVTDTEAAKDPSIENTTVSVLGGTTAKVIWRQV